MLRSGRGPSVAVRRKLTDIKDDRVWFVFADLSLSVVFSLKMTSLSQGRP